jgi:hypothetical protein
MDGLADYGTYKRVPQFKGRTTILAVRSRGVTSMCDYSLYGVASRPAKVGDKLVSKKFTITGGFAAVGEPNVAVCLLPGTEVAFEKEVEFECISGRYPNWKAETKLGEKLARFRQVDKNKPHTHHDALEFADGQIVLVTRLCEGKRRPCCNCQLLRGRQMKWRNKSALSSLPNPSPAVRFM